MSTNTEKQQTTTQLSGNELGSLDDIKNFRRIARKYYHDNIQGKIVNHITIGEIRFTKIGGREVISQAAQNAALFPKLPEIIENSEYIGSETPNHNRKDGVIRFHILYSGVNVAGEVQDYTFLIAEDALGNNKFYYIKNVPGSFSRETVTGATEDIYIINDGNEKFNPEHSK